MNFLKYYLAITISLFLIALPVLAGTNLTSKEQVKVGFIYVGPVGDHGWTYMHDKGRLMVEEKFGDKVKTIYRVL